MSNYSSEKDYRLINHYATSISIDREIQNEGQQQLEKTIENSKKIDEYLSEKNAVKQELIVTLTRCKTYGVTEADLKRINYLKNKLAMIKSPDTIETTLVQTQEIFQNSSDVSASNLEFANKYQLDLNNPFNSIFSDVEKQVITNELAEKFELLTLDKYDYAFSTAVGILGGIIDILLVGTASSNESECGQLVKVTDGAFDKIVEVYAKLNGWKGANGDSNSVKSAIGYLERKFPVNYDARYSSDINHAFEGMNTKNHHLLSLDHSPLGLIIGIIDLLQGKASFFDSEHGKIIRVVTEKCDGITGIPSAIARWFGHCMSDIAGSSGAQGRGAGLPTAFQSILQTMPIGENGSKYMQGILEQMYTNGYDLRFSVATAIPVIVSEIIIRLYWFVKQHFYYGKNIKECIPFGKNRDLQRMLLISSFSFSSIDIGHAIIKGAPQKNPIVFLNSVNYIGLANFGYKLFVNFRLEHEHNQKNKELLRTEIKSEYQRILNESYIFSDEQYAH
ncbi:MAG: hypothetical protein RR229_05475 [Oscillospiraceae bacterium]